ncbi:MAG: GRP family sugar transporter [Balneolaceae bacterium]
MTFLIFAFMTAFFESLKDLFGKLGLGQMNEYVISWAMMAFSLPFLLPLLFFIDIPELNNSFFWALIIGGLLNSVSIVLYMRAIKASDLSITIPMITFTPLFLLITSPVMLGEYPSPVGTAGVLLIVFGSYMLNIKQVKKGFFSPFKALFDQPGPLLMLFVAFLWSFSANIDKIGIQNSSPIFWSITVVCFVTVTLLLPMLVTSDKAHKQIYRQLKALIPLGLFNALGFITQMIAINLALVAYVISIKRGSAILSVLWGYFFLGEAGLRERLLGVIIMVAGVMLITLS